MIEALQVLDSEGVAPDAISALLNVARFLADDLYRGLDRVSLPKGEVL